MAIWTCPDCGRRFGGRSRTHTCEPATTVDEWFGESHAELRPIFEAIADHIAGVDGVFVEPVQVGFFFKGTRTFAELRPRRDRRGRDRFRLSVILPRRIEHAKVASATQWTSMWVHHVDLYEASDVDEDVLAWVAESADLFAAT